jgi:hypothetical protein
VLSAFHRSPDPRGSVSELTDVSNSRALEDHQQLGLK